MDQSRGTVYLWHCDQVTSRRRLPEDIGRHLCLTVLTISYVDSCRDIDSYVTILPSVAFVALANVPYINVLNNNNNFQGTLEVDDAWLVSAGDAHEALQTVGPAATPHCCNCRRVDCIDLLRRPVPTSPGLVDHQRPLANDREAPSTTQNSTRPARPRPPSDVIVTPI